MMDWAPKAFLWIFGKREGSLIYAKKNLNTIRFYLNYFLSRFKIDNKEFIKNESHIQSISAIRNRTESWNLLYSLTNKICYFLTLLTLVVFCGETPEFSHSLTVVVILMLLYMLTDYRQWHRLFYSVIKAMQYRIW